MSGKPRGKGRGRGRARNQEQQVRRPGENEETEARNVPVPAGRAVFRGVAGDESRPGPQVRMCDTATNEMFDQMKRMSIRDGNRPGRQEDPSGVRRMEMVSNENHPNQQNRYQEQGTRPREMVNHGNQQERYQHQGARPKEKVSNDNCPNQQSWYRQQGARPKERSCNNNYPFQPPRACPAGQSNQQNLGDQGGGPRSVIPTNRNAENQQQRTRQQGGGREPEPNNAVVRRGTLGRPVPVLTNAFVFESTVTEWILCHYHVEFNPVVDSKNVRLAMIADHHELLGSTRAFDGMTLFMPRRLQQKVTEVYSTLRSDNTQIRITITLVAELPPNSNESIRIYNIIFKRAQRILGNEQIGTNYYNPSLAVKIEAYHMEIMPGFLAAIQKFESDTLLILDVAHKMVQSDSVLDKMYVLYQRNSDKFWSSCYKLTEGKIVLTRYNNKTYRISDIDKQSRPTDTFQLRNGQNITYVEYYRTHYNITDLDPDQPLLVSRPTKRDLRAGRTHDIYLLPQLCYITGLTDEINSDMRMKRDMQAHTRVGPQQRVQTLMEFAQQINRDKEVQEMMNGWNVRIPNNLLQIQGRQLDQEIIYQKDKRLTFDLESCDWFRDMRSNHLTTPVGLRNWVIIWYKRNQIVTNDLIAALQQVGPPMGMNFAPPVRIELPDDRITSYITALRQNVYRETQLVMCVLPTDREDRYSAIKKFCCIEHPVPSQMVVSRTISKKPQLRSVATKIAAQLNCKLGGELWTAAMPTVTAGLMVVGIDTYHHKGENNSVGGIVCSLNKECTRYYSGVTIQMAHQELIDGLLPKMMEGLKKYHEVNGKLPGFVVVYRDGVGDGQLDMVINHEVQQILDCFKTINPDYQPKLSVIIVKKRIGQRFYISGNGCYSNPKPGTVVDSRVTKSDWEDFFLVSQSVLQGTVTPTHYNVIYDTTNWGADRFQKLTYKLCHLYYNWTGTIRVPAPCQYAHKLAYLVGENLHSHPNPALADRLFFL